MNAIDLNMTDTQELQAAIRAAGLELERLRGKAQGARNTI